MPGWGYAYSVARIRALETKLLTDADIEQLIAAKDEDTVLSMLKERGWGSSDAEEDAETLLSVENEKTWAVMDELELDPKIFDIFTYPEIYNNLKAAIKEVCTEEDHPGIFYENEKYGRDEILRIVREKDYDALPEHMRAAAESAYETLLHTRDGQMCDVIIDRAMLDAVEKAGKNTNLGVIRDYAGMLVAVTDIRIAARAAKTGKSRDFILKALAPGSRISVNELTQAASSGLDAVIEYLSGTEYAEAAEALGSSNSAFERWCDNQIIESIKPQKYVCLDAGPVVAYLLARQNEIKMVRIILTAKANGLPEEAIRVRARKMYV